MVMNNLDLILQQSDQVEYMLEELKGRISKLRVILPVAAPIRYNPAYYLAKAFDELGIQAKVIDQTAFYNCEPHEADLFLCVDSGGPLNIPDKFYPNVGMWYIDSRRNCNPTVRNPDDDTTGLQILDKGGIVFQAQIEDRDRLEDKVESDLKWNVIHLPLAADQDIWSNKPEEEKLYKSSFVGNCYDTERLNTLTRLQQSGHLHWPGIEKAIMEDGARVYRMSVCGVNIPSWYGTPECYDVNMRVFEIMSTATPLITNWLPTLGDYFIENEVNCLTYAELNEIPNLIDRLNSDNELATRIGSGARELILNMHTYSHRALHMLEEFWIRGLI